MKDTLVICVGNGQLPGDSLGPKIGLFISQNKSIMKKIEVIGTPNKPVGYLQLYNLKDYISRSKKSQKIIIDSALGNSKDIGKVLILNNTSLIGNSVNKGVEIKADILIKGVVGKNHKDVIKNKDELRNVNPKVIEEITNEILEVLFVLMQK